MSTEKPNFAQISETQIMNMKKRTSQIKGELLDGLTDIISKNFEQTFQFTQQLCSQIDQRDKKIVEVEAKLEKCYNAHPELKITEEAEKKKTKK